MPTEGVEFLASRRQMKVGSVPRRPMISREAAAREALAIIDEVGLDGLTLQGIATRIGVRAQSLYNYFSDRKEVLHEVALLIWHSAEFDEVPAETSDLEGILHALVSRAMAIRRSILAHPKAAPLLLELSPRRVFVDRYDDWMVLLERAELTAERRAMITEGMEALTHGGAILAAAAVTLAADDPAEREARVELDDGRYEDVMRTFLFAAAGLGSPPPRSQR